MWNLLWSQSNHCESYCEVDLFLEIAHCDNIEFHWFSCKVKLRFPACPHRDEDCVDQTAGMATSLQNTLQFLCVFSAPGQLNGWAVSLKSTLIAQPILFGYCRVSSYKYWFFFRFLQTLVSRQEVLIFFICNAKKRRDSRLLVKFKPRVSLASWHKSATLPHTLSFTLLVSASLIFVISEDFSAWD